MIIVRIKRREVSLKSKEENETSPKVKAKKGAHLKSYTNSSTATNFEFEEEVI